MNHPTIREVAKLAGVAVGTVSNVLNGTASVRRETRERVETAMRQLGFRPDAIARSLIARRIRKTRVKPHYGQPRLSTLGYISVDYTAKVSAFPSNGQRMTSYGIEKSLGGPAANVAVRAAGLGGRCALDCELITALGADADSKWALTELAERGVSAVTVHPYRAGRLSRCIVLVDEAGARTIVNEPFDLEIDDLRRYLGNPPASDQAHCLHTEGYHAPSLIGLLGNVRRSDLITSVHTTGLSPAWLNIEGFAHLLASFDLVFLNRDCAHAILGGANRIDTIVDDMEQLFHRLASQRKTRLLVLLLGADGAVIYPLEGPTERVAAISVPVADTTGAGDTFVGCFLAAWLNGDVPADAGRLAAVAASLSVSTEGAQGACISMETLADYGIPTETARAYKLPGAKTASTPSG